MGLPLLTEKTPSKMWTTMTWAVCEGDGVENDRVVEEAGPLGA